MVLKMKKEKKVRRTKIERMFILVGVVMGILTILGVLYFCYRITTRVFFDEKQKDAYGPVLLMNEMFVTLDEHYAEVFDMWVSQPEELDIVYDDENYEEEYWNEIKEKYGKDVKELLAHFDELDLTTQREVAKFYYMHYLNMMNWEKEVVGAEYLNLIICNEKGEWVTVFSGKTREEKRGNSENEIYKLGRVVGYSREKYGFLYDIYENPTEYTDYTFKNVPTNNDSEIVLFMPFIDEEGCFAILGVAFESSELNRTIFQEIYILLICLLIFLAVAFWFVGVLFRRRVVKPISRIERAVSDYVVSKDSQKLSEEMTKIKLNNEIGSLCEKLSNMGVELTDYIAETRMFAQIEEKHKSEMEIAFGIQQAILAKDIDILPENRKVDLFAHMRPAKEVGGDYYNYFMVDEDHLAIIVGDVSGKGVPASLYMMICMVLFNNENAYSREPSEIVSQVNKKLLQYKSMKMMSTAWMGILELSTGRLSMTNAGHEIPIVVRSNGQVEKIENKHDFVMGLSAKAEYCQYDIELYAGDYFVMYSDGVPEATNCEGAMLGMEGLVGSLSEFFEDEEHRKVQSKEVGTFIEDIAVNYQKGAEQYDDITVLVMRT